MTTRPAAPQRLHWRPSAALQVAHEPRSHHRLAATLFAAITALTLLIGLAAPASAAAVPDSETAVAAQTDANQALVGPEAAVSPVFVGANASAGYDSMLGCCVAPNSTRLTDIADDIRTSGGHPAARNQRTIAVGEDAAGDLYAGSSNGFDAGQRAALETNGVQRVPGSGALHAEEELLRAVDDLQRVGTSVRSPCGPSEHNCLQQLIDRGVTIE